MSMNAYTRQGNTVALAANASVSAPVKVSGSGNNRPSAFRVSNPDSGVTIFYAWGQTANEAIANCAVPTANAPIQCDPLPSGAVEIIRACNDAWFCVITASGSGTLYISPGEGL